MRRYSALLKDRRHHLFDTPLYVPLVRERPDNTDLAGASGRYPLRDEASGVDQEPRAGALSETMLLEVAHLLAQFRQVHRHRRGHAGLPLDDLRLQVPRRVVELDRHESLAGALLQVLEGALVARVVGDDEQEAVPGLDDLAPLLHWEDTAVVPK